MQTCFETFGRWVPLKKGQELNILTSKHQFVKIFKYSNSDFLYFFAIFQDVSTTLHYIKRTEKKEQQITNYER